MSDQFTSSELSILRLLQKEGRMSNVELAERIGMSESPCFRRVRALEESGVIRGYSADLDQRALGLQVTAFVQVNLEKQTDTKKRTFLDKIEAEDFIVECHAMSGSHDYLLKVVARSMDHFSDIVMDRILQLPGVAHVESNFSLQRVKEHGGLPVS